MVRQLEDSCKWTTVVQSGVKRRAMAATPPTPSKATARSKGLVIGSALVKGMTDAVKRKRRANIFTTRFSPDQCPDELKSYGIFVRWYRPTENTRQHPL